MVNDSSDYRFDAMPFGGFKYGSMGREGVRFAYENDTAEGGLHKLDLITPDRPARD
jgi:hypothetical protein